MTFGKRILILVPHPDDEIVACAATIARAREAGAQVFALYLTHGCIARDTMWAWERNKYDTVVANRRAEGEVVAAYLGITPVGWSSRPARYLWQELATVDAEVAKAVRTHNIDQLWVPAYEGGNPDHDGLNALAQLYIRGGHHGLPALSVLEFTEYNFAGRKAQSQSFPVPNGTETVLVLNADEQRMKRDALALYASEQMNLGYVDVAREAFRPLAATYDYSKPPHEGKLWYARFNWVPFRHPRVDFTNPADVCAAMTKFLDHSS